MTVTLNTQIETRLRERAEREGQDVSVVANALIGRALAEEEDGYDPDDLTEENKAEIRAGIRRGLEAVAQGRERSVAEYIADVQKRRAARQSDPVARETVSHVRPADL
jgi:predicted transcriptional regulator